MVASMYFIMKESVFSFFFVVMVLFFVLKLLFFEKGFGTRFLWCLQFGILRMSLGQWKSIHGFGKSHDEIFGTDISRLDRNHGLYKSHEYRKRIRKKKKNGKCRVKIKRRFIINHPNVPCFRFLLFFFFCRHEMGVIIHYGPSIFLLTLMTASATSFRVSAVRHAFGNQVMCTKGMLVKDNKLKNYNSNNVSG